jgi:hypothetical protein
VVAVDVGKTTAAALVTDAGRHRLLGPLGFSMTAVGVGSVITKVRAVVPAGVIRGRGGGGRSLPPATGDTNGVAGLGGGGVELRPGH